MTRLSFAILSLLLWTTIGSNAADPFIAEFMASNENSITDEDGEHSDWIEIRNPGPDPVNLNGWYLTDDVTRKTQWQFPSVTLNPGTQIIVFASGKNRRTPGANLHTKFSLKADGEYLALVKPDGVTVAQEFAPAYPPQYPDVSYGITLPTNDVVLFEKGSSCKALVPTVGNGGSTLGTTWRQASFDDNTWTSGTLGVGFFNPPSSPDLSSDVGLNTSVEMTSVNATAYIRIPFNIADLGNVAALRLTIQYDDGFASFVNGSIAASRNSPAIPSLTYTSQSTSSHAPNLIDQIDLTSSLTNIVQGANVLAIHGLNSSAANSDFFILPKLVAKVATGAPGETGYFASATPAFANGNSDSLLLPQIVNFSRPPGTFTATFQATLSGAVGDQQIRYIIANTSAAGANAAEPTASSTLYSGPITIDQSKLIRAAVFNAGGTQKGLTKTVQYLLLETAAGTNNTSNFTSNLPIVVISDHGGGEAVDSGSNTYTTAMVHTFEPVNGVASLKGPLNDGIPTLFTRAGFRIRGSSSAGFNKKSYGLELWNEKNIDEDHPLLGLESDSDWILNGPFNYDDTYIHNAFIYEISRRIGRWAPRTKFCEVFIDKNVGKLDYVGDYNGVYVMTEKIKSNKDRLDIASITPVDTAGPNLTGGYIFKIDRVDSGEVSWKTSNGVPHGDGSEALVISEPDPDADTPEQISYLQTYVQQFDTAIYQEAAANFTTRNYRNFIDVSSFVDHHILNSLSYNVDALRLSAFYFKDRGKKINAGPIWDFDRSLGSDDGRDANPQSWANIDYFFTRDWWGQLFRDPDFVQAWVDRWWELREPGAQFELASMTALSTQMGTQIGAAAAGRDAIKFPENAPDTTYLNEITKMNNWLTQRVNWIDSQMPQRPTSNVASGVVTPGATVTLGGPGSKRYTLNGTDPRAPGGGILPGVLTYSSPIPINTTTVITVRPLTGSTPFPGGVSISWGPPKTFVYLVNEAFAVAGDIAITEINYHPVGPTPAEVAAVPGVTADDFEYVELRNVGSRNVNLFETKFLADFPFTKDLKLKAMSLAPGDFALVVRSKAAFQARYGAALASKIAGEWVEGSLSDDGEEIRLVARDGTAIQTFIYSDGADWPSRADGKGSTLEYKGVDIANASYNLGTNWRSSSEFQGSPGVAGTGPDNRIVINELLTNSAAPFVDAIELKNTTADSIEISNWYISDVNSPESPDDFKQYRIPNGTSITGGGYRVFTEVEFNPNGAWNPSPGMPAPTEFAFNAAHGDDAWILEGDASGKILRFVDHIEVGPARTNETWGRWPDQTGDFYPMANRTLFDENSTAEPRPGAGGPNSEPRVGPLVITEIHHSPDGDNTDLEFVEIFNPTGAAQPLDHWRLRGAVDFDFAPSSLEAGSTLVVVPFDPSNAGKANAFRNAYGISGAVTLVGPWGADQHLAATNHVILYRAEPSPENEPFYFPLTIEDETTYASGGDWPITTTGLSLNRRHTFANGFIPANWEASIPSPGSYILNNSPVAQADSYHIALSDNPASLSVLANDTDADNDPLTIASVSTPANGTAQINGNKIDYTPGVTFQGVDTFTYTVEDDFGGSAIGTVTIVNAAPTAVADNYHLELPESGPLTLPVLANDSDADNDSLVIISTGAGTISGGSIEFTPDPGFNGNVSFNYTMRDSSGGTASAAVTIANQAPVAVADSAATDGTAVVISVLANDTDADSDLLKITGAGPATGGTVTTDGTSITFTPDGTFAGSTTFSYTISDLHGGTSTGSVTVRPSIVITQSKGTSGQQVPEAATGTFYKTFQVPAIGSDGTVAWISTVTAGGKKGTMLVGGNPARAIASVGEVLTAITGGVKFTKFDAPVCDDDGRVVFVGTFAGPGVNPAKKNNVAVFATIPGEELTPIARLGTEPAGVSGGRFAKFSAIDAGGGETIYAASLVPNAGGVNKTNDHGVWAWDSSTSTSTLVLQTGRPVDTSAGTKTVATISLLTAVPNSPGHGRSHRAGEVAMRLGFTDKTTGIAIATRTGDAWSTAALTLGGKSTLPGAQWKAVGAPSLGTAGETAALVTYQPGTASATTDTALMLFGAEVEPIEIARESGPSGIAGVNFAGFVDPVASSVGTAAFVAKLSGAGVTPKNNSALVSWNGTAASIVARTGNPAIGVPGTIWKKIVSFALPSGNDAGPVFLAQLAGSGVTPKNNVGLWAAGGDGTPILLARTGIPLAASGSKVPKKLLLLNALPTVQGSARSFNDQREVVYVAVFTDNTQAVLVARVP